MKKQINPNIKAYLLRSAFCFLLLVAVCAIPLALAQRNSGKQSKQNGPASSSAVQSMALQFAPGQMGPEVCIPSYTLTLGPGIFVPGDTDVGNHCDNCSTEIALPFPVTLYDQTFTIAAAGSNGHLTFGVPYDGSGITCWPSTEGTYHYDRHCSQPHLLRGISHAVL